MNIDALIGLADMRRERDPAASEFLMEAARDILRLRSRLVRVTAERDELRHKLFELTGDKHAKSRDPLRTAKHGR